MQPFLLVVLLLLLIQQAFSEVVVNERRDSIYDKFPKLRISGQGFTGSASDYHLTFVPELTQGKDFMVEVQSETVLVVKLLVNKKWVKQGASEDGTFLALSELKIDSVSDKNLLSQMTLVAYVIPSPQVFPSTKIAFQTETTSLRIDGTGLKGKKLDLYFDPPLFNEVEYVISRSNATSITLKRRHDASWRSEPGPLYLKGIDTGAGGVDLTSDAHPKGVLVAEVQADLGDGEFDVFVEPSTNPIYRDTQTLVIRGGGFVAGSTSLQFVNGLMGRGVNYTITSTTSEQLVLSLKPDSHWRRNTENMPGPLTLLAVNVGNGWVPVGPVNAKKGRVVATVFERPFVSENKQSIYQTHTHQLVIRGSGFTKTPNPTTQLLFSPPLHEDEDYTTTVLDKTQLVLTLQDGKKWTRGEPTLRVLAANTLGTSDGFVYFNNGDGVIVASVMKDEGSETSNGISIHPSVQPVYNSVPQLHEVITVSGEGFMKDGKAKNLKIVFTDTSIVQGSDFDLSVLSDNTLELTLKSGKSWGKPSEFGDLVPLIAAKISDDGGSTFYPLGGSHLDTNDNEGIRVATVYPNPTVTEASNHIFQSHSKAVIIKGTGFTNLDSTTIKLSPTYDENFHIVSVSKNAILLRLEPEKDWLPSSYPLNEESRIPLNVITIDTGAGEIMLANNGARVGYILKDKETHICDDSCEFAFDGMCDDGSEPLFSYYGYYFYDDDYGGLYGDDMTYGTSSATSAYDDDSSGYYDDYYWNDESSIAPACLKGTDCTDCGGIQTDDPNVIGHDDLPGSVECTNTCQYARDGLCDDPRGQDYCDLGTDCQDCGPASAANFSSVTDDMWWDDEDDYWNFDDDTFVNQHKGWQENYHRFKGPAPSSLVDDGPGAIFITVMEGTVYTIGIILFSLSVFVFVRWYKGYSIPFLDVFDANSRLHQSSGTMREMEMGPITPDVTRT